MSQTNFFERIKKSDRPVVVDFWAPWCGPCKMIDPMLRKLEKEYDGQVEVWKVNADEQPEVLRSLKIYGIPTVIGFKDGQEVARQTGAGHYSALAGIFESALSGELPAQLDIGLTWLDRLIRLAIGAVLLYLAYLRGFQGIFLLIAGLGVVALFSAVHDRCPVWQALKPKLKALLKMDSST